MARFQVSKIYKIFIFAAMRPSVTFETVVNQTEGSLEFLWRRALGTHLLKWNTRNSFDGTLYSGHILFPWVAYLFGICWKMQSLIEIMRNFKLPIPLASPWSILVHFLQCKVQTLPVHHTLYLSLIDFWPSHNCINHIKSHRIQGPDESGAWLLVPCKLIWIMTSALMSHVMLGQLIHLLVTQVSHVYNEGNVQYFPQWILWRLSECLINNKHYKNVS